LVLVGFFISCEDDVVVKPSAMLRLEYKMPTYSKVNEDCSFSYEKNEQAVLQKKKIAG
jgi:protein involved in gliding motility GldD